MSKREKLLQRLMSRPTDFTWKELVAVMEGFGYELKTTGGSGRKFIDSKTKATWMTHEPHPKGILKSYQISELLAHLKREKRV